MPAHVVKSLLGAVVNHAGTPKQCSLIMHGSLSDTALIVFTLVTEALNNLQTVLAWFGSVVLLV